MIVAFTGHRPPKAGLTWSHEAPGDQFAVDLVQTLIREYVAVENLSHVIVGGALGFDTLAARAAWLENVPFHLYVPFPGSYAKWPPHAQDRWHRMRKVAAKVVTVNRGSYHPSHMQTRNEAMVNAADALFAWWDGSAGGTRNCLDYADQKRIPWNNLYPDGPRENL